MEFVEQFPCPTCQYSVYCATECGAGLATTVGFTYRACGAIRNLKNTCGENSNLHLEQGAAMKAEKQLAEAAERGGRLHRLVQVR